MATIDTSIYSRVGKGGNLGDVLTSYAQGRQANIQGRLSDLELSQAERQAAQSKAVSDAYAGNIGSDGGINRQGMLSSLAAGGHGGAIPGLSKSFAEQDKGQAELNKIQAEGRSKALESSIKANDYVTGQVANLLLKPDRTAADVIQTIGHLAKVGIMPPEMQMQYQAQIPQGNPQALDRWLRTMLGQTLSNKERFEALMPKVQIEDMGGHKQAVDLNPQTNPSIVGQRFDLSETFGDKERARHNRASEGLTARGQNMSDSRARESTAAVVGRPFEVTGEDGKPMLVQQDKAGNIRPVTGYMPKAADKPLTEGQAKAVLFGSRMQAADAIVEGLAKKNITTSTPGSRSGFGFGAAVNAASKSEQQQLDQAKRDFINAALRRESGAAIAESEFDNAEKQYFPQIGDSDATKAQKATNRAIAVRGMQAEIPKAQRGLVNDVINGGTGGASPAPAAGGPKTVNFSDLK